MPKQNTASRHVALVFLIGAFALFGVCLHSTVCFAQPNAQASETPRPVAANEPYRGEARSRQVDNGIKTHGFQVGIFGGVHTFLGDSGKNNDPGLRTGVLLGGRFSELFSLNGELLMDVLNPKTGDATEISASISIVPTFHLTTSFGEIQFAPKFGGWVDTATVKTSIGNFESSATGILWGTNLAVVFHTGRLLIGPLLMVEHHILSEVCSTSPGSSETCISADATRDLGGNTTANLVSLNVAMWF